MKEFFLVLSLLASANASDLNPIVSAESLEKPEYLKIRHCPQCSFTVSDKCTIEDKKKILTLNIKKDLSVKSAHFDIPYDELPCAPDIITFKTAAAELRKDVLEEGVRPKFSILKENLMSSMGKIDFAKTCGEEYGKKTLRAYAKDELGVATKFPLELYELKKLPCVPDIVLLNIGNKTDIILISKDTQIARPKLQFNMDHIQVKGAKPVELIFSKSCDGSDEKKALRALFREPKNIKNK
ncbi:MAG: hypothetical protein AABZ31_11625, partial [Bdellovibrionota bacterium]